jgi:hypothetical protein
MRRPHAWYSDLFDTLDRGQRTDYTFTTKSDGSRQQGKGGMHTREQSRRFSDLTHREIGDCAKLGWLVVIPTGCTEQQGPHLPVDFDTWFAESLMVAAAEKAAQEHAIQTLVLPAMPFGPTPEHRHFGSGFIDLPVGYSRCWWWIIRTSLPLA